MEADLGMTLRENSSTKLNIHEHGLLSQWPNFPQVRQLQAACEFIRDPNSAQVVRLPKPLSSTMAQVKPSVAKPQVQNTYQKRSGVA